MNLKIAALVFLLLGIALLSRPFSAAITAIADAKLKQKGPQP
jgi:hypothetical protein